MFILRKTKRQEELPVAMSGVRMGERALQIGIDDPALLGALASKVGLSGHAAIAVSDEAAAATARGAAEKVGALVDLHVSPLHSLPIADSTFDVVVLHAKGGWFAALDSMSRVAVLPGGNRGSLRDRRGYAAAGRVQGHPDNRGARGVPLRRGIETAVVTTTADS
jgi:hypothetical protein